MIMVAGGGRGGRCRYKPLGSGGREQGGGGGMKLVVVLEKAASSEPGVNEDVFQLRPVLRLDLKALPDQILALWGETDPKADVSTADLLVGLKWDVTANHVKEEDPQRPDCGLFT